MPSPINTKGGAVENIHVRLLDMPPARELLLSN